MVPSLTPSALPPSAQGCKVQGPFCYNRPNQMHADGAVWAPPYHSSPGLYRHSGTGTTQCLVCTAVPTPVPFELWCVPPFRHRDRPQSGQYRHPGTGTIKVWSVPPSRHRYHSRASLYRHPWHQYHPKSGLYRYREGCSMQLASESDWDRTVERNFKPMWVVKTRRSRQKGRPLKGRPPSPHVGARLIHRDMIHASYTAGTELDRILLRRVALNHKAG